METNPYAIRLELIKLAKEMEFDTFYNKKEKIQMLYGEYQNQVANNVESMKPFDFSLFDSLDIPDAERINKVAEKLYEFVSNKK
jgi:hypothetical protein